MIEHVKNRLFTRVAALGFAAAGLAGCAGMTQEGAMMEGAMTAPPGGNYQNVSALVALPEYIPGLGALYIDPATLPAGPFLAYDREGKLAATIYMPPLEILTGMYTFDNLNSSGASVDHVDMYFNGGHPGAEEPHYHVVLWHIPADQEASLQ